MLINMVNPQEVIDESRPMIEDFLCQVGIYQPGERLAEVQLRDKFSEWLDAQEICEEDFHYVTARVAAFICEYLIEGHSAIRFVEENRILLRLPVDAPQGVYHDFDPYTADDGLVRERKSLKGFLETLCR